MATTRADQPLRSAELEHGEADGARTFDTRTELTHSWQLEDGEARGHYEAWQLEHGKADGLKTFDTRSGARPRFPIARGRRLAAIALIAVIAVIALNAVVALVTVIALIAVNARRERDLVEDLLTDEARLTLLARSRHRTVSHIAKARR